MRGRNSLLLASLLVFAACEEKPYYEQYRELASGGWPAADTLRFEVEVRDTQATYAVLFHLRANAQYPFSNLYLFRQIYSEIGMEYRDTSELKLADPYGRWLGDGPGDLKTFSRPYRPQPLRFNRRGNYTFSFVQAMRRDTLAGVRSVGLTLYKQDPNERKEN